ncbi:MAG: SEC-C domain-containing protein [Anaerolineae bacterium]|nr:SEC-C domain-containing protein [Anaerolineae bacterium]
MKRGDRVVHADKELLEKLGRNDPCPCGSARRFQELLHEKWSFLTDVSAATTFREK